MYKQKIFLYTILLLPTHYNLLQAKAISQSLSHLTLSRAMAFHWVTPIALRSFFTPSNHLAGGIYNYTIKYLWFFFLNPGEHFYLQGFLSLNYFFFKLSVLKSKVIFRPSLIHQW